jgi:outer membrane protein OmpA-like peptidoglycan-associated protein
LRKKHKIEENAPKAPLYIVTFSTLTTLLLAFFVVLVSMGTTQDETLLDQGYKEGFWVPFQIGFGVRQKFSFDNIAYKHAIRDPNESTEERTIDANTERLRRIVKKLSQTMNISPSPITSEKTDFSVTDIHFSPGDAVLNEPARQFLSKFCINLQQVPNTIGIKLCVLGLASDGKTEKEQYILSAKRAQAVAAFLQVTLPSELKWPIYSWGGGAGGDWVGQNSPISEQSHICIAILRPTE